jgi:hypothetical protein
MLGTGQEAEILGKECVAELPVVVIRGNSNNFQIQLLM